MELTIKNIKKELDVNESEGCNIAVEPAASSKKQKSRQSARKSQKSNQYSKLAAKTSDIGGNSSQLPICVNENPYYVQMFPSSHDSQAQPSCLYFRKLGFRTARKSGRNNSHGKAVGKFPGDLEHSCSLKGNNLFTVKNIKQEVDGDHIECKTIDEHITDSSKISECHQSARKNKQQSKFNAKTQDGINLDPSAPDLMETPYGTVGAIFNVNDKQRFSMRENCDIVKTVEDFKEKLNSVPKVKPISRAEFIFNAKKSPVSGCLCLKAPMPLRTTKDNDIFCQAVDAIDDKLIGCCQPVSHYCLVQPSSCVSFTIMCDMHIWKLQNHYCCPRCGMFCSQGTFVRCKGLSESDKVHHLFHRHCVFNVWDIPCCPHCGNKTNLNNIDLDLTLHPTPAAMNYPDYYKTKPLARMTFPTRSEGLTVQLSSGSVLSSYGLFFPKDIRNLEDMLKKLKTIKKEEVPTFSVQEFYSAVIEGHTLKVLLMLYKGVYVNSKFPEHKNGTALHAAAKKGHVIEAHLLVQAGCEIDSLNDGLQTPVMVGTQSNNLDIVLYLVSRKADVDIRGKSGSTCLHLAAKLGDFNMCTALLTSLKIDLNLQDDDGWTPIVWASKLAHFKIVELLLVKGADPNIRDKEGNTALHWAAYNDNRNICEICIKYGCGVNEVNLLGDTPLHVAARRDNSSAVECLLIANAALEIKNRANLTSLDCCINDSKCSQAIKTHAMILALAENVKLKMSPRMERIVISDISFGKEKVPIQCVNWFDTEEPDKDFLYITENCETSFIKIDRSIASLQYCSCENDCDSLVCTCGNISFKCWYDKHSRLVADFNMIDPPLLFECNRACMCDVSRCRNRVVQKSLTCRLQLFRTAKKGWGVRTLQDIPKGAFICEYVGELISDSEADKREDDSYLFDLDNRDGETYCLDARRFGNISRFINHLCDPNLVPIKVFVDHQDLSFPRMAFFSARDIAQYEELGFDYGEKFWVIKSKWFTCNCGLPGCKYSSETIKETLAAYSEKISDDPIGTLIKNNL